MHAQVPRPGQLRRARLPLEAAVRISSTLQVTNTLPYTLEGSVFAFAPPLESPIELGGLHDPFAEGTNGSGSGGGSRRASLTPMELLSPVGSMRLGEMGSLRSGTAPLRPSDGSSLLLRASPAGSVRRTSLAAFLPRSLSSSSWGGPPAGVDAALSSFRLQARRDMLLLELTAALQVRTLREGVRCRDVC